MCVLEVPGRKFLSNMTRDAPPDYEVRVLEASFKVDKNTRGGGVVTDGGVPQEAVAEQIGALPHRIR